MHSRETYTVQLTKRFIDDILFKVNEQQTTDSKTTDDSAQWTVFLTYNSLLVVPYVNIDGYYYCKSIGRTNCHLARKNRHRYTTEVCQKDYDIGVDLNRNFDVVFGSVFTSGLPCGEEYRGSEPFSQPEVKAIQQLFVKGNIKLVADIHSWGNKWIHPFAYDPNGSATKGHSMYWHYQELKQRLGAIGFPLLSCNEALGYVADGVFIDWALNQNALSFAFEFAQTFDSDQQDKLELQITQGIKSLYVVATKLLPIYQVSHKSKSQKMSICVKSISLVHSTLGISQDGASFSNQQFESGQQICYTPNKSIAVDNGMDQTQTYSNSNEIVSAWLTHLSDNELIAAYVLVLILCILACCILVRRSTMAFRQVGKVSPSQVILEEAEQL